MGDAADKFEGLWPKCQIDAFLCTKKIGDDGKRRALYAAKEQGLTLIVNYAPVNLCDLEICINLRRNLDDLVFGFERVDERTQVLMHRVLFGRIIVKPFTALAAEPTGVDILFEQRASAVFRVPETLVKYIKDREANVQAYKICKCQGSHR